MNYLRVDTGNRQWWLKLAAQDGAFQSWWDENPIPHGSVCFLAPEPLVEALRHE